MKGVRRVSAFNRRGLWAQEHIPLVLWPGTPPVMFRLYAIIEFRGD